MFKEAIRCLMIMDNVVENSSSGALCNEPEYIQALIVT